MMLKHTGEFDLAYRFINETNKNIFLTGKAGTGKTTFLKYLRENTIKKSVVTAPTGVAAINARGITLHSLFQLPLGIILPEKKLSEYNRTIKNHSLLSILHYNKEKLNLLRNLELLIIDEASMVASYTIDAIDTILRYIRRKPFLPFGGVQLLFIGDLYQLPPVIKKEEWEILQKYYSSIFFFDSFVLRNDIPIIIELKEIFRQKDDKFIEILNGIRNNNISNDNFNLLNSKINRNFSPKDHEEYITLTTHNYQSDEINKTKLSTIEEQAYFFNSEIINDFPEHLFPAENELKLKIGAQVMFIKNDTEGKKYFNGKLGVLTELNEHCIKVKCKNDPEEIEVKKSEWQNINYKIDPETNEIKERVLGSFIQYPLRLAWAITIHKSQGLTFNKLIIDAAKAFAKGQVYVALSRCTSLEGLVLKTPIYRNFLGPHEDFKEWQSKNYYENLQQVFVEEKQNFILEKLESIFTWEDYYFEIKALNELLLENQANVNVESFSWIMNLMEKQKKLYEVSEKFRQILSQLSNKNSVIEKNDLLQKKIKDGALYFYNEISCWQQSLFNHPLSIDTKKVARKVNRKLEEINLIVEEKLQKINYCKNGFSVEDYINNLKLFEKEIAAVSSIKIRSSYKKRVKGNTVMETVELLHNGKSVEQIAFERNLSIGTIESHLSKAIRQDLIQLEEVMPLDEIKEIVKVFPKTSNDFRLSYIKEKLPSKISYGKLKMIIAWLQKSKN